MEGLGRADTHLHTHYSGFTNLGIMKFPESTTSPEKQVDCARRHGFDVICITDHNHVEGGFVAQRYAKRFDDIEVVVGDEIMTSDGEIIGFGLNEYIKPFMTVEETVDKIREQGGLTIAPHPFSFHVQGLKEKIFDIDLDAFEVINGGHPDAYSNNFAQMVMKTFPGRWAPISASDAHSNCTMGYNWTEFEGNTAEDLRKAILKKTTIPVGRPAPVLGEVQWSYEVAVQGMKLTNLALKNKLEPMHENRLYQKILSNSRIKNFAALVGGIIYCCPLTPVLATALSTAYLWKGARRMNRDSEDRLEEIAQIIEGMDSTLLSAGEGNEPRSD